MASSTFNVRIDHNAPELRRKLNAARRRQVPFAIAAGLTELAFRAQRVVRRELPFRFTIRSRRVEKGVRVERARKSDWPNISSATGTIDEFMALHETGGEKRSPKGRIAIPTRTVARQRTAAGRIPKRLKPKQLLVKRARIQESGTNRALIRLKTKVAKRQRRENRGATIFFLLRRRAIIKPRWEFGETATGLAATEYAGIFQEKLAFALKTAR